LDAAVEHQELHNTQVTKIKMKKRGRATPPPQQKEKQ